MSLRPETRAKYLGIEIEFAMPTTATERFISHRQVIDNLNDQLAIAGLRKWVHASWDRSIDVGHYEPDIQLDEDDEDYSTDYREVGLEYLYGGHIGVEFRVLVKQKELRSVLPKVLSFIKRKNGYVNESCGLHVHLDMRLRNFRKSTLRLYEMIDTLYDMMPEHRKCNDYCRFSDLDSNELQDLRHYGDRYKAINLQSFREHKTLEVRCHEATLDSRTIINWAEFLVSVVDNKPETRKEIRYVNERVRANSNGKTFREVRQGIECPF